MKYNIIIAYIFLIFSTNQRNVPFVLRKNAKCKFCYQKIRVFLLGRPDDTIFGLSFIFGIFRVEFPARHYYKKLHVLCQRNVLPSSSLRQVNDKMFLI